MVAIAKKKEKFAEVAMLIFGMLLKCCLKDQTEWMDTLILFGLTHDRYFPF